MTLPKPRPDLGDLEGYHSPQLDVAVRLNTNESPYPPPPAFVDAWLEALRAVPLNRYPERGAHELRSQLAAWLDVTIVITRSSPAGSVANRQTTSFVIGFDAAHSLAGSTLTSWRSLRSMV